MNDTTPTTITYRAGCGCFYWPLITIGVLWLLGYLG